MPRHLVPALAPTRLPLLLACWPAGFACIGSFSHLLLMTNWGTDQFAEALLDPGVCSSYVETPNFARWWIQASAPSRCSRGHTAQLHRGAGTSWHQLAPAFLPNTLPARSLQERLYNPEYQVFAVEEKQDDTVGRQDPATQFHCPQRMHADARPLQIICVGAAKARLHAPRGGIDPRPTPAGMCRF